MDIASYVYVCCQSRENRFFKQQASLASRRKVMARKDYGKQKVMEQAGSVKEGVGQVGRNSQGRHY